MPLYTTIEVYFKQICDEAGRLPDGRKQLLDPIAAYVSTRSQAGLPSKLVFICTHNSRRSIISQIWATALAAEFGLDDVTCFSGGTEATAFNRRAVEAMERAGFVIADPGGDNPRYIVSFSEAEPPFEVFSKVFDDTGNPTTDFAAIMTCADADENCPFIPGATRFSLPYEDPKVADGTAEETARYDERVKQIGAEMLYLFSAVSDSVG